MAELSTLLPVVEVLAPLPLVLRGGLAMRLSVAPAERPVDDVDVLSDEPHEIARARVRAALLGTFTIEDETTIWEESDHPGVRWALRIDRSPSPEPVQVDLGFGDPRGLPEVRRQYPGTAVEVSLVAPEVHWSWKVHGLFERGPGKWRAKDLWDLHLLQAHAGLDRGLLPECLGLAFRSRRDELESTVARFLGGPWGESRGSRRKWTRFARRRLNGDPIALVAVRDGVRAWVRDALNEYGHRDGHRA